MPPAFCVVGLASRLVIFDGSLVHSVLLLRTRRVSVGDYRKVIEVALVGRSYNQILETAGSSRQDVSIMKKTVASMGTIMGLSGRSCLVLLCRFRGRSSVTRR